MTDNDNFEKRLLTELRQVSAENPAPANEAEAARPRKYGRFAAAGAGLAAVVAGIVIYTSTGDNTPSAYAVEKQDDGKVAVEITDLEKADGLEASLVAAGVPAEVMPVATVCAVDPDEVPNGDWKKTSPAPTVEPAKGDVVKAVPALPALPAEEVQSGRTGIPAGAPGVPVMIELKKDAEGASFSIDPAEIPKGETVIIAPSEPKPADKMIPANAPSAPPIAVSIGAPAEPPC